MSERCLICSDFIGDIKNKLTNSTVYSNRPLYAMFENCMSLKLPPDIIDSAIICENCYLKFNEIDEHQTIAEKIQNELFELYNGYRDNDNKEGIKVENYEEIEEHIIEEYEEIEVTSKPSEPMIGVADDEKKIIVEKSPKKARTYKSDEGQPYTVIFAENGKRFFQCHFCNKMLSRRPKDHIAYMHCDEKNFKCETCGSLFKRSKDLARHRRIHGERTYRKCDLCDMKYTTKTQLRKHIEAIHLGKKNHTCPTCGKSFSRDTSLNVHMTIHQPRERKFNCTICEFKTFTKEKLKRHLISHSRQRNFACEICGKQFLYSYNVTQHINFVHKGIRPKVDESKLTCSICNLKFQKQWKLKQHLMEEHGIEEETAVLEVNWIFE